MRKTKRSRESVALLVVFLCSPRSGVASAQLSASATALNSAAGSLQVQLDQHCYFEMAPACADSSLTVSTGPHRFGLSTGFAAFEPDLATGQIRAFVVANGGYEAGGWGVGSYSDLVTLHLVPGYSWPQTFTVRAVLEGTFSDPTYPVQSGTGSYFTVSFFQYPAGLPSVINENHFIGS